jgi:DNA-binding transcriptional LysR family regulator
MKTLIASTQYQLGAAELEVLLAMVRTGTLAAAGERLGVDASTVFRAIQRIERGLGQSLFDRSRAGYRPSELAQALAEQAERVEAALEAARSAAQAQPEQVSGTVRISTTDTLLHGLIAPALQVLQPRHPALVYELHAGNELVSLTRRDTDIAVRATKRPPQHLVGRQLGMIRSALYAGTASPLVLSDVEAGHAAWIAPDDALPDHPSVRWRKKQYPKAQPTYRVNSLLTVMELVALGMGVGVLPLFLAQGRSDLRPLTGSLADCETELWLLTHPESRHLRRIATVYGHLAETVQLP